MADPKKRCNHPQGARAYADSCTDRCDACGMVYAMIQGKRGVSRRWVMPGDRRIAAGRGRTLGLLGFIRPVPGVQIEEDAG